MALNFPGTNTDILEVGDLADAKFDINTQWTFLAFFRVEDTAGDDRAIVTKWGSGSTKQIIIRARGETAPFRMQVLNDNNIRLNGDIDSLSLDTWYCVAVNCDGAATVALYTIDLSDYSFIDDNVSGTFTNDTDMSVPIQIGGREAPGDLMDGDIDHVAYIKAQLTKEEIRGYAQSPESTVYRHIQDVEFYYQLGRGFTSDKTNGEQDLSGNGNTATYFDGGTSNIVAAVGPPVMARLLGWSFEGEEAGAPAAVTPQLALTGVGI